MANFVSRFENGVTEGVASDTHDTSAELVWKSRYVPFWEKLKVALSQKVFNFGSYLQIKVSNHLLYSSKEKIIREWFGTFIWRFVIWAKVKKLLEIKSPLALQ